MRGKKWEGVGIVILFFLLTIPWWYHTRHTRSLEPPAHVPPRQTSLPTSKIPPPKSAVKSPTSDIIPKAKTRHQSDINSTSKIQHSKFSDIPLPAPGDLRNLDRSDLLPRLIYIPPGDRAEIFASLKRQGLPLWGLDRFLLLPSRITPGWIRLKIPLSLTEFFRRINEFPRERTRRVVMYSGDSLDDFIRQFSRQTRLPKRALFEEYFRYSPYIDGGILAGYYRLPYRLNPAAALAYLTGESEKRFRALAQQYLGRYEPAEFKRYLIIASIIQRETWRAKEMPRIASVIYNRLRRGMKLQIDATLNYGPYSHVKVTPERIRRDNSRFNTYKFKGLPPEPLGSVTLSALKAALQPAQSNDLYFVRDTDGFHRFAPDYATHLAHISRIKAKSAPADSNTTDKNPPAALP